MNVRTSKKFIRIEYCVSTWIIIQIIGCSGLWKDKDMEKVTYLSLIILGKP